MGASPAKPVIIDNTNRIFAQERAKRIDEQEKQQKKEETEKAAKQAQLDELARDKQQIIKYKFGNLSHPSVFQGLDTSDVSQLRIAVLGPFGSGKSSFINTIERTLTSAERGTCAPQSAAAEGTLFLQTVLEHFFFKIVDTRGLFNYTTEEITEFILVLKGQIREAEILPRESDETTIHKVRDFHKKAAMRKSDFSNLIHAVVLVVKADDPRLRNDLMAQNLKIPRGYLKDIGITVVTVVTHGDKLQNDEERQQAVSLASRATGSPENQTFLVSNYIKDGCPVDVEIEQMVLKVLHYVLTSAERFVKIAKLRMKYAEEDAQLENNSPHNSSGNIANKAYSPHNNAPIHNVPTPVYSAAVPYGATARPANLSIDMTEENADQLIKL